MPALSRRTFDVAKRYETLIFKEGTHPGDFEIVELQDIQNAEREGLASALITDGFIGSGFKAVGGGLSNAVQILTGEGFDLGRRLLLPDSGHQLIGGQYIFNMQIATPVTNRVDLIYLDIFLDTVTSAQDPVIEDLALGPTADRERVQYVFRVAEGSTTVPTLGVGHEGLPVALVTRRANDPLVQTADVVDARPLAALNPQFKPQNTIIVSPAGGDFTDPGLALASISGSSASNPYTVIIMPGVYTSSVPLAFGQPYVSMIGVSPDTCSILVAGDGLNAVLINADHIVIRNLKIGFTPGTAFHSYTLKNTGAYTLDLENVILSEAYYNENDTNSFAGVDLSGGGTNVMRGCVVYAQANDPAQGINVGPGTLLMEDCAVYGTDNDAIANVSGGSLTAVNCQFYSSIVVLASTSTMIAYGCQWTQQTMKTSVPGPTAPISLSGAVTNTMINCVLTVVSAAYCPMSGTTAQWSNVQFNTNLLISGGGLPTFRNCVFSGLAINGTFCDLDSCTFLGSFMGNWSLGQGESNEPLVVYGGTYSRITGCRNQRNASKIVFLKNSSPLFKDCHLTLGVDGAIAIIVVGTSKPVIDNCMFEATVTYSPLSGLIHLNDTTSLITLVGSHARGLDAGQPSYFVNASNVGSAINSGRNTGLVGALVNAAKVTATDISL